MSSKFEKVHGQLASRAQGWTLREQFLDTDRLRRISYGNLVLRREAHLFLTHGVIVSVICLLCFWLVSANWNNLMALTGLFKHEDKINVQCYEIVTNVTQLPPPPPIAPPEPPKVKAANAPVEAPPNVGKIKKVADASAEQTLATQKEIKQVIQQGAVSQGDGANCDNPVLEFVECQDPPRLENPSLKPMYPEMARIAGIEGRVFVRVLIGEDGKAMKSEIVKRVPQDCNVFDKEAVRFVMSSKYIPGKQNNKRVRVWMTIPVRFTLHGD
ncbi:MAG: energy transducer TonB [Chlorobiaceae bacterium]|nr:energy transducer TonB [Chlorobiaceae bacterium]